MKAISLLSGGLDSTLAIRVIQEQNIEIEALNLRSVFCNCTPKTSSCSAAATAVRQLGVNLRVVSTSEDFIELVRNPKHGYGRNLNPCIDCRILMFRTARSYMEECGARFVVTGEVLGERPMSQRRQAMELIERESGLEGLIVRPLCARHMEPSIPEKEGWIDRTRLLDIKGRSRKAQIELAEQYGLSDYPCPAGGCLLTDSRFAAKMKDLMAHSPDLDMNDVSLLKQGRHFRLSPETKLVVGRNEKENERIRNLARDGDILIEFVDLPGPLALLRGRPTGEDITFSAAATARYGKADDPETTLIRVFRKNGEELKVMTADPADDEVLSGTRVHSE